jgi:hypothetical protein
VVISFKGRAFAALRDQRRGAEAGNRAKLVMPSELSVYAVIAVRNAGIVTNEAARIPPTAAGRYRDRRKDHYETIGKKALCGSKQGKVK